MTRSAAQSRAGWRREPRGRRLAAAAVVGAHEEGGRRRAIGATMAIRALGCWSLAGAVGAQSTWMYLAALVCLIASKAYGVTRASAVPRLLPEGVTLVRANSRISLAGIAGAAISAPLAGLFSLLGLEW